MAAKSVPGQRKVVVGGEEPWRAAAGSVGSRDGCDVRYGELGDAEWLQMSHICALSDEEPILLLLVDPSLCSSV